MTRLYLDTNQWNHLVGGSGQDLRGNGRLRSELVAQVDDGRISVVGSYPLLQEIAGTVRSNPAKYRAMRELAFQVVGRRWVPPIGIRYKREATFGGQLPDVALYLSRRERRGLERQARSDKIALTVALETRTMVDSFKRDEEEKRRLVLDRLAPADDHSVHEVRAWCTEVEIDDWVRDTIGPEVAGQLGDDSSLRERVPSAWLFVAFSLARVALNVGEGRRIGASDGFDREHFAACAYADVLVTDDRALREKVDVVSEHTGGLPFRVESFADLTARLGAWESPTDQLDSNP